MVCSVQCEKEVKVSKTAVQLWITDASMRLLKYCIQSIIQEEFTGSIKQLAGSKLRQGIKHGKTFLFLLYQFFHVTKENIYCIQKLIHSADSRHLITIFAFIVPNIYLGKHCRP